MKTEQMLEKLGDIAPEFIEEAAPRKRRSPMGYASAAAAALVLVLGVGLVLKTFVFPGADNAVGDATPHSAERPESAEMSADFTECPGAAGEIDGVPTAPEDGAGGSYTGNIGGADIQAFSDELAALVNDAECIVIARCIGFEDELTRYALIENVKGEMPETFAVKNGVHTVEEGRCLLFLQHDGRHYDSTGVSTIKAALVEDEDSVFAVDMPEGCSDCGFEAVTELVKEIVGNDK